MRAEEWEDIKRDLWGKVETKCRQTEMERDDRP